MEATDTWRSESELETFNEFRSELMSVVQQVSQ